MKRPEKLRATVSKARKLRREMSPPERLLWRYLRASPNGIRFRRQHPAGPYVLDFFCARANLAIELDGMAHNTAHRQSRDTARDAWMRAHRIDTLRIPAAEVLAAAEEVAESILVCVQQRLIDHSKSPPSDASASATSPTQVVGEKKGK